MRKVVEESNYRGEKTQQIFRSNDDMANIYSENCRCREGEGEELNLIEYP